MGWLDEENVQFKIEVHNNHKLKKDIDIVNIVDKLPKCLEYIPNSATVDGVKKEPVYDSQFGNWIWEIGKPLKFCNTITILFDAHVRSDGENVNKAQVQGHRGQGKDEEGYSIGTQAVVNGKNNAPKDIAATYEKETDQLVVKATDPDGHKIKYGIDWNKDGKVDQWTDLVPSGTVVRIDCNGKKGQVGIIVEDEHGAQSVWIFVTSKNKEFQAPILIYIKKYLEQFSLLQIIQYLQ